MSTLISLLSRALRPEPTAEDGQSPRQLLERADACAGQDARELRAAASAWLRVIR